MTDLEGDVLIAGFQAFDTAAMPNPVTITRTGTTTTCRVARQPTMLPLEVGWRVRAYRVAFPYGTVVLAGDRVVVTLDPRDPPVEYAIQQITSKISYATRVEGLAVPTTLTLASPQAPEQARFQNPRAPGQVVDVYVHIMGRPSNVQTIGPSVAAFPWMAAFDESVRYPNGSRVSSDHQLAVASVFGFDGLGNPRAGTVSRPRPVLHGLPFSVVYMTESAG